MKLKLSLLIVLFLVILGMSCYSDRASAFFDWKAGKLLVDIRKKMPLEKYPFPRAKSVTAGFTADMAPEIFLQAIMRLRIDSYYTLEEAAENDESLLGPILKVSKDGRRIWEKVSDDFTTYNARYVFDFYGNSGIINIFDLQRNPFPIERYLGFVPTRKFSGFVIYAKGFLRAHGKRKKERVNPAMFFKLLDEDMNVILEREMCYPDYLKKWGMAAYTDNEKEAGLLKRVGAFPLNIMARGVFGKYATDIIISRQSARQILALKENIETLKKCRIVIVIDSDKLDEVIPVTLSQP